MIEPIASVAEAERELNEDLNDPLDFKRYKADEEEASA
jgi:hypothetical protein